MLILPLPYFALALVAICVVAYHTLKKRVVYPPSPPGHWLFGNLMDMPRTVEWDKLLKWKNNYGMLTFESPLVCNLSTERRSGGITYLTAFGKSMVLLNDMETNKEFFDKRAKNYSHRPQTVVVGELMGLNKVRY